MTVRRLSRYAPPRFFCAAALLVCCFPLVSSAATISIESGEIQQEQGEVTLCVSLATRPGEDVAGTENLITWDERCAAMPPGGNACTVSSGHGKDLQDTEPRDNSYKAIVISFSDLSPMPAGELYCCDFIAAIDIPGECCQVLIKNPGASDPHGNSLSVGAGPPAGICRSSAGATRPGSSGNLLNDNDLAPTGNDSGPSRFDQPAGGGAPSGGGGGPAGSVAGPAGSVVDRRSDAAPEAAVVLPGGFDELPTPRPAASAGENVQPAAPERQAAAERAPVSVADLKKTAGLVPAVEDTPTPRAAAAVATAQVSAPTAGEDLPTAVPTRPAAMEKVDGESPARRRPTLRNPVQQVARTDNDDGGFWGCQLGSTEDVGWPLLIGLLIVPSLTRRIKRRHHQL